MYDSINKRKTLKTSVGQNILPALGSAGRSPPKQDRFRAVRYNLPQAAADPWAVWSLSGFSDFKKKEMQRQRMRCKALPASVPTEFPEFSTVAGDRRAKLQNQTGFGG